MLLKNDGHLILEPKFLFFHAFQRKMVPGALVDDDLFPELAVFFMKLLEGRIAVQQFLDRL